jgi:fatty acid-binding protein DegV
MLGSLLSIKPMIDISTGSVEEAGKHRTRKKSLEALRDKIREGGPVEHLAIMHGMAPDIGQFTGLLDEDGLEYRLGHIGAVIGSHGGPRVVGACWLQAR